jgi:uncharacterized LabA/DUF88 family protein
MTNNSKVAILIDGGFFKQRFKELNKPAVITPTTVMPIPLKKDIQALIKDVMSKVQTKSGDTCKDTLFRTFYYDSLPYSKILENFDKKGERDFGKSRVCLEQTKFIESLKSIEQFALRMGELSFSGWKLDPYNSKTPPTPDFRQKGVDMKIGLDMAWLAGKRTVDKIVLVTGDSDFISPIKLVRREGILVYLYPMGQTQLKVALTEHADFIIN